jgi:hypothetical protein
MNSLSSSALPRLLSGNELPQDAVAIRDPPLSTTEIFHRKIGGRLLKGRNPGFIPRATQRVFPLRQPAIQWWQLELPLQRDLSFQSPPAAGSWELDLSQE